MRRVIYCPTEDRLPETNILVRSSRLPVNVGDFEQSIDLDFDRNIVQVLEIPEIRNVIYMKEIQNGFHQKITYFNDFIVFNQNFFILINNQKYFPAIVEKHKLKFVIEEKEIGIKNATIINSQEKIEEFEYNVY
jgi:hypothetical protein